MMKVFGACSFAVCVNAALRAKRPMKSIKSEHEKQQPTCSFDDLERPAVEQMREQDSVDTKSKEQKLQEMKQKVLELDIHPRVTNPLDVMRFANESETMSEGEWREFALAMARLLQEGEEGFKAYVKAEFVKNNPDFDHDKEFEKLVAGELDWSSRARLWWPPADNRRGFLQMRDGSGDRLFLGGLISWFFGKR